MVILRRFSSRHRYVKGIVHPKMKIQSLFTHPNADRRPGLFVFLVPLSNSAGVYPLYVEQQRQSLQSHKLCRFKQDMTELLQRKCYRATAQQSQRKSDLLSIDESSRV